MIQFVTEILKMNVFGCISLKSSMIWFVAGWTDIGYNFLIGGDGRVYEGRGWGVTGGHTYGYNSVSVAISYIGTFDNFLPSQAQLQAGLDLLDCAERQVGYIYLIH